MFRRLSISVAAALSVAGPVAAQESKLDSGTFKKLVVDGPLAKSDTDVVVFVQKKYGYDSKSLSFNIREGISQSPNVMNFDLELDTEAAAPSEDGGDKLEDEEGNEEAESDWKKKERIGKESDSALITALEIDAEQLPFMALFRRGKIVDRLPVDTESTEFTDVETWLGSHGILMNEKPQLPEFEAILEKFAAAEKSETWNEIISEAEALAKESSADSEKSQIYVKVLRNAAKNGKPKEYTAKELKRVMNMLNGNAINAQKKVEMRTKVGALKSLSKKMEL